MIAILVPTRGRPEQFKRMCESVEKTTKAPVTIIPASNGGDEYAGNQYPIDCPTVFMWNDLAAQNIDRFDLFMLGSDDIIFATPGWAEAITEHYNNLTDKAHVYALQDSRDPEGTPHIICTKEWIKDMGWFLPPIFNHFYVDTWSVEIAKYNGCFTHMRDYLLVHDKANDRGSPDDTHKRIRNNGTLARDASVAGNCNYLLEYEKQRLNKIIRDRYHEKYNSSLGAA